MRCTQCGTSDFNITLICPHCGVSHQDPRWGRLYNLSFLLTEMLTWSEENIPQKAAHTLYNKYAAEERTLRQQLGAQEASPAVPLDQAQEQLRITKKLHAFLVQWVNFGWLDTKIAPTIQQLEAQLARLTNQVAQLPPPAELTPLAQKEQELADHEAIQKYLNQLHQQKLLEKWAHSQLTQYVYRKSQALRLEIAALLQPTHQTTTTTPAVDPGLDLGEQIKIFREPSAQTEKEPPPPPQEKAPRPPKQPAWTWDQLWDTLLSEKTLQAILFLGVLLLIAGGVSWVTWNWETFPPVVQVGFLSGFTTFFYVLSWYVQTKLHLRTSSIALSAVGSLLIPLDFYAFYLSGGFPAGSWPQLWWITSLVCLVAYLATAYALRAEFFGYLVAAATGSLAVATLNWLDVPIAWWSTAVMGSSLLGAVFSQWVERQFDTELKSSSHWASTTKLLGQAWGRAALVTAIPILLVGMGMQLTSPQPAPAYLAMALNWWLGAAVFTVMVRHYRFTMVSWAILVSYPLAVFLTANWFSWQFGTLLAWTTAGWVALGVAYWLVAARLAKMLTTETDVWLLRPVWWVGLALFFFSAFWSLLYKETLSVIHPALALVMLASAVGYRNPRYFWFMSLFTVLGVGGWIARLELELYTITLPLTLLSVIQTCVALLLRQNDKEQDDRFYQPLFGASLFLAVIAIFPPLVFNNRPLLLYALGNWIGINAWFAYLTHQGQILPRQMSRFIPTDLIFQWFAGLSFLGWVVVYWNNSETLPLGLAIGAFVLLAVGLWSAKQHPTYGQPWYTSADVGHILGAGLCFWWLITKISPPSFSYNLLDAALPLALMTLFYFGSAVLRQHPFTLYSGAISGALALTLAMLQWGYHGSVIFIALGWCGLGYMVVATVLENTGRVSKPSLRPLYYSALGLICTLILLNTSVVANYWDSFLLPNLALTYLISAGALFLYAWQEELEQWAHSTIWILTIGGGLFIKAYTSGSGRSAALMALLTILFVVGERGLMWLAQPQNPLLSKGWRLYHRPLLVAGWVLSVATIAAALLRNMILLGGGLERQLWSILALGLITGLYTSSAWLFRRTHFFWFASVLIFFPWALATDLYFDFYTIPLLDSDLGHFVSFALLCYGLVWFGYGVRGFDEKSANRLMPSEQVAHLFMVGAILFTIPLALAASTRNFINPDVGGTQFWSTITLFMASTLLFYGTAVWLDRGFDHEKKSANPHFWYAFLTCLPIFLVYLRLWSNPAETYLNLAVIVLACAFPYLLLGRFISRYETLYPIPFYQWAYVTAAFATLWVVEHNGYLAAFLLFNTVLTTFSVWFFRQPRWWYVATALLPLTIISWGEYASFTAGNVGLLILTAASLYLLLAFALHKVVSQEYGQPLLLMMYPVAIWGLIFASASPFSTAVGFTMAAVLYGSSAVWLKQPTLFHVAAGMLAWAYVGLWEYLGFAPQNWAIGLWPGIVLALALMYVCDAVLGVKPSAEDGSTHLGRFPWTTRPEWPTALLERFNRWWGMGFGAVMLAGVLTSSHLLITPALPFTILYGGNVLALFLGAVLFGWLTYQHQWRGWLLATLLWGNLALRTAIIWLNWFDPAEEVLLYMPILGLTLCLALLVDYGRGDGSPFVSAEKFWKGWSRPIYLVFALNLFVTQFWAFFIPDYSSSHILITVINTLFLAAVATIWLNRPLVYASLLLGYVASWQFIFIHWQGSWFVVSALMALMYGVVGYFLRYGRVQLKLQDAWLELWETPLCLTTHLLTGLTLLGMTPQFLLILGNSLQFLFSNGAVSIVVLAVVREVVIVVALLGLLYLTAAWVDKQRFMAYGAMLMLLNAWVIWGLLLQQTSELQVYAFPAGCYLLIVAWLEWEMGNRQLAEWLDRLALFLLLGSAFYQAFGESGRVYAILMVGEGLVLVWLGSFRRVRRFLYAGVLAVVCAVASQIIRPLLAIDSLLLFFLGGGLIALGVFVQMRLDAIRELSKELQLKLEQWD